MEHIDTIIEMLKDGKFSETFEKLYVDTNVLEKQQERYCKTLSSFKQHFSNDEVSIYSAPGRSEVGGNHTDHQHGHVLATAVTLDMIAVVGKRDDMIIEVYSQGHEIKPIDIRTLSPQKDEKETSEALIRGVCYGFVERGYKIGGLSICMQSDVLGGSGLSSSAAFEILIGTILSGEYNNLSIDAVELAKIGQFSENNFFMKPCGLMDQMACSVGGLIAIDFKDTNKPIVEKIDFEFVDTSHALCIVDTKGSHADLTDEYSSMPTEMKQVASLFNKNVLREVTFQEFLESTNEIRKKYGDRAYLRAYHYFLEDDRAIKEAEALKRNDFELFKKLFSESSNSSYKYLQNVVNIDDVKNQALAVGLALSEYILKDKGVGRVHGGGFAGTIQAFVPEEKVREYKDTMEHIFGKGTCYVLQVRPYGGYKVI